MNVTKDIRYIGVNDHEIDLFEGMYIVPEGMAYNSYVILDEKVAVMDTADRHFVQEWLGNLEAALEGKKPDYLIVQHMEPDHSSGSFLRYRGFYGRLSGSQGGGDSQSLHDDEELHRHGLFRTGESW